MSGSNGMCKKCNEVISILEVYLNVLKDNLNNEDVCREAIHNLKKALEII